ncbi:hypothetical protein [Thiohalophilus thiocyanatoxydans]|uniref:Uncharacterized protein n=1 Tax=Thiohalophilus thiocyanatoxydans TaxID=381308 RepID=A0A4R8ITD7_9GAMM|nr:hypothetical protein [Thiohalophilus thiocyanatoxydans]TDY03674.1 hypothetical protein EDC23_0043 [Thiohalophilus thiocyanatoxydans]
MKLPWRKNKTDEDELIGLDQERISLERVGHSRIDEAVSSVRKTPWSLTLLQLLWTAGPVTFLAMEGGYYLGFGHAAPLENFVFFAAYTLILGVIGLLARFVAIVLRGRRQDDAREVLSKTLDLLPDLLFESRDGVLQALTPEARRLRAAGALLHELDLSPESVALAVRELTGDASLAEITEQIEIYRRLGLRSRVQDLIHASAEARAAALEKIHATAPDEADLLRDRLTGVAPSFEHGVPRRDNFLGAIFSAADEHNLDLMALEDVQELLVLVFELLSGREITRLVIDYEGGWQLVRSLDEVEAARSRYSVSQAMALSRLHALAARLMDYPELGLDESVSGLAPEALLTQLTEGLERLVSRGRPDDRTQLKTILEQVRQSRRAVEELHKWRERYVRDLRRWEELRRRSSPAEKRFALPHRRARGLRIREDSIVLDDAQKIEIARQFCNYLRDLGYQHSEAGLQRGGRPLQAEDLKRLAIRLALILQPYVQLADASVQRAIYSSRAAYLGGLETGFSADAKAGLGAAAVREVQEDLGKSAEHLALRITRVYRLPLSESMIDFLVAQYHASRERLEVIAAAPMDETPYSSHFTAELLGLSMDSGRWRRITQRLEQLLQDYA